MSRLPSQNGAFNGPGRQHFDPSRPRRRDIVQGQGDAFPAPGPAEIAAARHALGQEPSTSGGAAAWAEMGWDPELMCWTDPDAQAQAAQNEAWAAARDIEMYPATSAEELLALRDRELREAS